MLEKHLKKKELQEEERAWIYNMSNKPPVANCFATDRSKAVTLRVLTFVNCLKLIIV
jgi:hypothetical protein